MARKKPKVNLSQPIQPRGGEMETLFAGEDAVEQSAGMQLLAIRLDNIRPDPTQPRQTFLEESLRELSESIKQDGVIQPIEVAEVAPNSYLIVHGERRWRAARLAGLETIPAVVRRRDYDEVTRFVRQLVENIQREDLNDVDRAAGLLRLRDLMQDELDAVRAAGVQTDIPWGTRITWAKVGQRLGYSRQRISQLINVLDLPEEIQEDVRDGRISERDTRLYRGLKKSQQRALHKARIAGDISEKEAKQIARILKENPDQTVYQTARLLRQPVVEPEIIPEMLAEAEETPETWDEAPPSPHSLTPSPSLPPEGERITNTRRLSYVRQHLARIQRHGLAEGERQEILRLLRLIEQDVSSLIAALESDIF